MPVPQVGDDVTSLIPQVGEDVTALMEPVASHDPAPERSLADKAVDVLPLLGGIGGGILGAPTGPGAIGTAALGGAAGQAVRRIIQTLQGRRSADADTPLSVGGDLAGAGAEQGVGQAVGMGAGAVLAKGAKLAMRGALGAQQAVRTKFPTVDLEKIALREGVGLGADVGAKAAAAHQSVGAAGRAADAAGAAKIQPSEMVSGLRKLYDKAGQVRRPDAQKEIVEAANDARKAFRGGVSVEDALAIKSDTAAQAAEVMQGAANPRAASTTKKVLGSMSRATGDAAKSRSPEVASALRQSQELMALEKAMKAAGGPSRLRMIAGAGAGVGSGMATGDLRDGVTGALGTYALTSPRALGLLAQLLAKGTPVGREGTRLLASLMASHDE